jgi:hypothetical protein
MAMWEEKAQGHKSKSISFQQPVALADINNTEIESTTFSISLEFRMDG